MTGIITTIASLAFSGIMASGQGPTGGGVGAPNFRPVGPSHIRRFGTRRLSQLIRQMVPGVLRTQEKLQEVEGAQPELKAKLEEQGRKAGQAHRSAIKQRVEGIGSLWARRPVIMAILMGMLGWALS